MKLILPGGGGGAGGIGSSLQMWHSVEVVNSNVAATAYATSGVPYTPLAKNATEQYVTTEMVAPETGTLCFRLVYAMSVSNGGDVAFSVSKAVTTAGADPDTALTVSSTVTFTPGAGALLKTLDYADQSVLGMAVTAEDHVFVKIMRKNVAGDTHTGSLNLLGIGVYYA